MSGKEVDVGLRTVSLIVLAASAALPSEMLRSYLTALAEQQLAARREKVGAIRTADAFRARQAEVRRTILQLMGGLPSEKGPLNMRRMGVIDRGDYRVEKIVFESQPRLFVTANLYVPATGTAPFPAILHPTGHSAGAKATSFYQGISLALVKSGFVVLTYDPVGQGERRIFYDADLADSKVGSSTAEHQMVGIQSLLAGESIARTMVWDALRALDVLESLPFVDAKRLGITGCSGGGTITAYVAALDDRLKVAAPACYITSWDEQLKGTGPQDAEQQFPDQLLKGIDHGDFVQAFAPKPYLICSTSEDFFPLEGARKTLAESKNVWQLFDASDKIDAFVAPGGHGVPASQLHAITRWMSRWLEPGRTAYEGPAPPTEHESDLSVTPTGQLATSLGGETASTLNIKRFASTRPPREPLTSAADVARLRSRIKSEIIALTRYEPVRGSVRAETLREEQQDGSRITHLRFDGAPGRHVLAVLALPGANARGEVVLYVHEGGTRAANGDMTQLLRLGYSVLAVDVSGIGETDTSFGNDKIAWLALMVGKTMTGIRMEDISRSLDLLEERGLLAKGKCIGFGAGSIATDLLHAAVVDDRFSALVVERGLVSFGAVARTPIHRRVFDRIIPGVLDRYDLPDLVAALAPRPVWLSDPSSPMGQTVPQAAVREEYRHAEGAYQALQAADKLVYGRRRPGEELVSAYPGLR